MLTRMTILAIESELNRKTPSQSITDTWSFGEGSEVTFDKSVLLATLINRCASLCVLYSDPDYFKIMSDAWWARWSDAFERWFLAIQKEYEPLENYDRNESWHDDIVDDNTVTNTGTVATTGSNTSELDVSAYDSSSYQHKNKTTDTLGTTDTNDLTNKIDNDRDVDHSGRIHGNIGVTTTQAMLKEELNVRYNNVYNMISDVFKKELLIAVY